MRDHDIAGDLIDLGCASDLIKGPILPGVQDSPLDGNRMADVGLLDD